MSNNVMETIILISLIVIAVLIIIAVVLQPSQKTGLIGDATDIEKREKRGAELFLYRATVVLMILFFALSLLYGLIISGNM